MKLSLIFSLCFLAVMVFGDLNPNSNPSPSQSSVENSKTLEDRIRELEESQKVSKASQEKSQEELNDLKNSCQKSREEFKEEIKLLKEKVEKLEQEISEDGGLSLLRTPLRGPPGKKGENGGQGPAGPKGDRGEKGDQGISALESITSCSDAMEILPSSRSKKQKIYPHGNRTSLEVLCDFESDGGGWTIIQKRSSGPKQEFKRNWDEYEKGFGSLDRNFWIGLENIHALTQNGDQELRIELEDFEGNKKYAKYSSFSVSDASDFYRLSISGFSPVSTLKDDMNYSGHVLNGMQFTTKDKDNDENSGNCAVYFGGGGWWFNACFVANLNGLYFDKGETVPSWQGIHWFSWKGAEYSLAKTEMKIRTRK